MFKQILFFTLITLLFSACANERGISARYYNDCKEYYDLQGHYHKDCPDNIIEYKSIKEAPGKAYDALTKDENKEKPKVW